MLCCVSMAMRWVCPQVVYYMAAVQVIEKIGKLPKVNLYGLVA